MVRDLCQYSESAGAYDDLAGLVELPGADRNTGGYGDRDRTH